MLVFRVYSKVILYVDMCVYIWNIYVFSFRCFLSHPISASLLLTPSSGGGARRLPVMIPSENSLKKKQNKTQTFLSVVGLRFSFFVFAKNRYPGLIGCLASKMVLQFSLLYFSDTVLLLLYLLLLLSYGYRGH